MRFVQRGNRQRKNLVRRPISTSEPDGFPSSIGFTRLELLTVLLTTGVLVAVLLPAVQNARNAAWKAESKNKLKQLGLAVHNYHDVYSQFPIGADVQPDGTANHGWFTRSLPYIESSPLYNWVTQGVAWDHPLNDWVFRRSLPVAIRAEEEPTLTIESYGVLHYMANPNVFHRNSSVSLDQMTGGTANNWLFGEVSGNYQPWGYPFNWRPLSLPFNEGPDSFGRLTGDGAFICNADGSVSFLTNETDPAIVTALQNSEPVASKQDVAVPDKVSFRRAVIAANVENKLIRNGNDSVGSDLIRSVTIDPDGNAIMAHIQVSGKGNGPHIRSEDIRALLSDHPQVRILIARTWDLKQKDVLLLAQFKQLTAVHVRKVSIAEEQAETFRQQKFLKTIVARDFEPEAEFLRTALPDCEVFIRK